MTTESNPAADWGVVLGLPALGLAGCDALLMATAVVMSYTGWRTSDLADRISRMIFSYGFALDVLAVALALGAIRWGGERGRRLGTTAILLVALSFALLFLA